MFRAFYQSAQFINWPAQSRNYRLGAQFINRTRNLEIESRANNEFGFHFQFTDLRNCFSFFVRRNGSSTGQIVLNL